MTRLDLIQVAETKGFGQATLHAIMDNCGDALAMDDYLAARSALKRRLKPKPHKPQLSPEGMQSLRDTLRFLMKCQTCQSVPLYCVCLALGFTELIGGAKTQRDVANMVGVSKSAVCNWLLRIQKEVSGATKMKNQRTNEQRFNLSAARRRSLNQQFEPPSPL